MSDEGVNDLVARPIMVVGNPKPFADGRVRLPRHGLDVRHQPLLQVLDADSIDKIGVVVVFLAAIDRLLLSIVRLDAQVIELGHDVPARLTVG